MLSNLRFRVGPLGRIKRSAQEFQGTSRRAVNFLPGENLSPKSRANLSLSNKQPILPQLINIEAQKLSGCIKMESSRYKSRSAALLYKGRVIAAVYGSKSRPEQVFGQEAYGLMMSEISSVNSEVSSYILADDLVESAAAMFHGGVFNPAPAEDKLESLSGCMQFIHDLAAPGSIAVVDEEGHPVCFLYLSGGSLLGINSLNSLVKDKDIRSLKQYIQKHQSEILANSMVTASSSIDALSFSLLGQSAAGSRPQSRLGVCSVSELNAVREAANLVGVYSFKPTEAARAVRSDRFISRRDLSAKQTKIGYSVHTNFDISTGA